MITDIIDKLPEAIIVIDPLANKVIHFNQAASQLWQLAGFDNISLPASHYFRHCLPALIGFTESVFYSGKGLSDELNLSSANDDVIPLEVTASKIGEQSDYLCLCIRDKDTHAKWRIQIQAKRHHQFGSLEWKRIHEVFQNIEKENQLILSAAGEGIYGVNAEGDATFFNPAAERMLGWHADEVIGKNIHSLIHHSHEDGSTYCAHDCPIYAAFKDGVVKKVSGDVFWTKPGLALPVDYTSTPILDNGQLVGAVVIFRDVSERIAAETNLRKALAEVKQLKARLEQENAYLQEEISAEYNFHQLVGKSPAISQVIQQIQMVAPTNATVLISGESGTGKELIARAIHAASERNLRPLVRVNCAAIPRELFESEFFGHVKGAFSGAIADRPGRFALADGGTLFLDEVGEIPLELQSKLLRVLQDNEFERVGESTTRSVNVRLIAATNQNLKQRVEQGLFREDLYYRLNVFPIVPAPLRERVMDIPLLVLHFLTRICQRLNKSPVAITLAQLDKLKCYHWPGNIRELENYLERQLILSPEGKLNISELPASSTVNTSANPVREAQSQSILLTEDQSNRLFKAAIEQALARSHGKIYGLAGAAMLLGVKPTTLASRIKKYGINHRSFKPS